MSVFGIQNIFKIVFVVRLVSITFLLISDSEFPRLGLPKRGFRMEAMAAIDFSWKLFLMNFGMDFVSFFGSLGRRFHDLFSLENRLENETIFRDITDLEPLN